MDEADDKYACGQAVPFTVCLEIAIELNEDLIALPTKNLGHSRLLQFDLHLITMRCLGQESARWVVPNENISTCNNARRNLQRSITLAIDGCWLPLWFFSLTQV